MSAPNVVLLSDDFSELDTNAIISIENADINDNLIVAIAESTQKTIVTHDGYFAAYTGRVQIFTGHPSQLTL